MTHNAYKNLSESELIEADHYAETGNNSGLRRMREKSAAREAEKIEQPWERRIRMNGGLNP